MDADAFSQSRTSISRYSLLIAVVACLFAAMAIADGSQVLPWVAALGTMLAVATNKKSFRVWSAMGQSSTEHRLAFRRRVVIPARVLVGVVLTGLAIGSSLNLKDASFVWDSLPVHEFEGVAYRWPGVYVPKFIVPPEGSEAEWYVTGGPYVPLPSDSPQAAAARLRRYLEDRFDIPADEIRIHTLLEAPRSRAGRIPPGRGERGVEQPYTDGMLAVEREYQSAAYGVLFHRLLLRALVVMLLGACLLRAQFWSYARAFATLGVTACVLALLASQLIGGMEHRAYRLVLPVDRFYGENVWVLTIASLAVAVGLLWWARQTFWRLVPAAKG